MNGWITIGTKLETKSFDKQILDLERKANDLEQILSSPKDIGISEAELQEIQVELEKTKNKIIQLRKEKEKAEETKGFDGLGKSIRKSIKDVSRLVLGIFGVRSAYMAMRRAASELATYDPQFAANLEYIRYVLTQAIAPVLRWIVQMAMQLLQVINSIINALFGINIFSKGSAENFNKMKAGAGGVAKAAKEIKKQLAGFDEINVLSEQNDAGGGGGAGGAMPSMDLSKIQGEPPKWLQWILDNGKTIISILAGIGAVIEGIKISKLLIDLGLISAVPLTTIIGIGIAIGGIVYAIMSLLDYLKDPTWENFGSVLQGIGIAIMGIAVVIGSVPLAVIGAVVAIVATIIKYWGQIKAFLQKGIDWLVDKTDWVRENFGIVGEFIYGLFVNGLQTILDWLDLLFNTVKNIFDGIIKFFKGVFTGDWKQAWEGIKQIFGAVWDFIKGSFTAFTSWVKTSVIDPNVKAFKDFWNTIKNLASGAWEGIKSVFSTVGTFFKNTFQDAWQKVKAVFSVGGKIFDGIKDGIVNGFKTIVNAIIGGINKVVSVPFNALNTAFSKLRNVDILGLKPFGFIHTINVPQIPKLKAGGIINLPNTGTMVGGMAIGGEAGREGVIPLTDQQAMAELGREIGRNVLVNLTNITSMNGRVISRELKNIQSEQDFAYNM